MRLEPGGTGGRSHRPVSCPHQLPADVEAVLLELRVLDPIGAAAVGAGADTRPSRWRRRCPGSPPSRLLWGCAAGRAERRKDAAERTGSDWVSRRVTTNGVVCVSWQQVSLGRHYAGSRCDVHVDGALLRFYNGHVLVKTAARTSNGAVRNRQALCTSTEPYNTTPSVNEQPKQPHFRTFRDQTSWVRLSIHRCWRLLGA
jgi:hypothetical protein